MVDDITSLSCPALHIIDAVPVNVSNHSLLRQTGDLTSAFAEKALSLQQCTINIKAFLKSQYTSIYF